ncbi:MAG: cytochrome P450, partial [Chloroflexota bacterium]
DTQAPPTTPTPEMPQMPALPEPDPTQPLGSMANPAIIDALEGDFYARSYAMYEEMRANGRMSRVRLKLADGDVEPTEEEKQALRATPFVPELWMLTHYDDVNAFLLNDDDFSVNPATGMPPEQLAMMEQQAQAQGEAFLPLSRSLLTIDPPDHTRLRRLVQPYFAGRAMEAMRPAIEQLANDLLDAADAAAAARGQSAPDRALELVAEFAYPLPVTVISDMLGVPEADRARVRVWTEQLLGRRFRAPDEEQRRGVEEFGQYMRDLCSRKRAEPGDDLISFLVQAEDEGGKLDETETLSMIFLVYIAGHITTVNLIGNSVVALLTHPAQMAAIRRDPSLTRNAVEETLRYWGPAESTLGRIAVRDTMVAGCPIHAGDRVMSSLASADRDPGKFANPDVFDISRPDANRHVAFGKGIHVCLGAPLARVEAEIALAVLFRRYPELRLAVPAGDLAWRSTFIRGFREIPLLV